MANQELIALDPREGGREAPPNTAARPTDLNGKVIGLLSNNKPNSETLLRNVAALLGEKYQIAQVIEANKGTHQRPATPDIIQKLVEQCDVVITATAE